MNKIRLLLIILFLSLILSSCNHQQSSSSEENSYYTETEIVQRALEEGLYSCTGIVISKEDDILRVKLLVIDEQERVSFIDENGVLLNTTYLNASIAGIEDRRSTISLRLLQPEQYVLLWYKDPLSLDENGEYYCNHPIYLLRYEKQAVLEDSKG